jgi:hypothetical protein
MLFGQQKANNKQGVFDMIKVENLFGLSKYHVTGEKEEEAAQALEQRLNHIDYLIIRSNGHYQTTDADEDILKAEKDIEKDYNVKIELNV